ncbi:MAG: hypothetical protein V3U75_05465 [Methylococcaceae bacterium]
MPTFFNEKAFLDDRHHKGARVQSTSSKLAQAVASCLFAVSVFVASPALGQAKYFKAAGAQNCLTGQTCNGQVFLEGF